MADVIRCPIKINLILRVFSKLPNGYHEIYSLFWQKTAAERLTIRPKYDEIIGDSLNIEGMKIEGENLVTKALAAARRRAEIPPLDVELEKFFPAGSGIGAGSGNAGAMLKLLAAKYGARLSADETARLGADVAFLASAVASRIPRMELRDEGGLREARRAARSARRAPERRDCGGHAPRRGSRARRTRWADAERLL